MLNILWNPPTNQPHPCFESACDDFHGFCRCREQRNHLGQERILNNQRNTCLLIYRLMGCLIFRGSSLVWFCKLFVSAVSLLACYLLYSAKYVLDYKDREPEPWLLISSDVYADVWSITFTLRNEDWNAGKQTSVEQWDKRQTAGQNYMRQPRTLTLKHKPVILRRTNRFIFLLQKMCVVCTWIFS